MKPSGTLVFMIAVLAILAILMSIFPKDGISVSKDLTMYFPSLSEWWQDDGLPSGSGNSFIPDLVEEDQKQQPSQSDSTVASSEQNADTLVVADMSDVPTFDSSVYNFKPRPINVAFVSRWSCLRRVWDA